MPFIAVWNSTDTSNLDHNQLKELLDICFPKPPRDTFVAINGLLSPSNSIFTLHSKNLLIGFALIVKGSKFSILEGVCVHPDFQGMGYCSQLLNSLTSDKSSRLLLSTRLPEFYQSRGFNILESSQDGSFLMVSE